jgi:hypothetical protein
MTGENITNTAISVKAGRQKEQSGGAAGLKHKEQSGGAAGLKHKERSGRAAGLHHKAQMIQKGQKACS